MSGIDEQIKLVNKIVNGEISKAEVERELDRIANEFGEQCFNDYKVKRKEKPWNKKDLDELVVLNSSGASSRDFYLYMAEVSEYLNACSKKKKLISVVIFSFLLFLAIIALVLAVKSVS